MLPVERAPRTSLGTAQRMADRPGGLPHASDWPGFEEVYGMSDAADTAKGPRCEESPEHAHVWRLPPVCHGRLGHPGGSVATLRGVAMEVAESRFGSWLKRSETRIFTDVGGFGCVGRSTFQISSLTNTPERR